MFDDVYKTLDEIVPKVRNIVSKMMDGVYDDSQRDCPVDTGRLKASAKLMSITVDGMDVFEVSYGDSDAPEMMYAVIVHENATKPYYKFLERSFIQRQHRLEKDILNEL